MVMLNLLRLIPPLESFRNLRIAKMRRIKHLLQSFPKCSDVFGGISETHDKPVGVRITWFLVQKGIPVRFQHPINSLPMKMLLGVTPLQHILRKKGVTHENRHRFRRGCLIFQFRERRGVRSSLSRRGRITQRLVVFRFIPHDARFQTRQTRRPAGTMVSGVF